MFFDPVYMLFVLVPSLILSLGAQFFVRSAYGRWSKARNSAGLSGVQVADRIFSRTGVAPIPLEGAPGELSDHFDPGKNVVRLSQGIATVPSVASMAVVAHELGHVEQYQSRSPLIAMRSFLLPAVQFSPTVSYLLIFLGLILNAVNLIWLGVVFFGLVVVFMLLTLPVEFDASRRGLRLLQESGLMVSAEDERGARQVLTAAALTYVAAAVTAVLQLLYYISLASGRSRD
jgi:Zn-dependent membrane protease YugP